MKYVVKKREGFHGVTVKNKLYKDGETLPPLTDKQVKILLKVGAIEPEKKVKNND